MTRTARDYLDAARARLCRDPPAQQVAGYGAGLLSRLLDRGQPGAGAVEFAELVSVYDALAAQVADVCGLDHGAAFDALVALCGEQTARDLIGGQPEPSHLRLLRGLLLWVTVTYETGSRGPARRTTAIVYRSTGGELRSRTTRLDCGYDDLPGRVRGRMLTTGQRAVRFQLYPRAITRVRHLAKGNTDGAINGGPQRAGRCRGRRGRRLLLALDHELDP